MGDAEAPENNNNNHNNSSGPALLSLLPSKEFISSRKGLLLTGEVVSSFIMLVCFAASTAVAFFTAPFVEFLAAFFLLFAYSTKINERFKGFHWPLMDFLRCFVASIIFFIVSIISVSKYSDAASKAAGVFGFVATIIFALDFYFIFNDLAKFLKGGDENNEPPNTQDDSGSDSE